MTASNWREMFEQPGRAGGRTAAGVPPAPPPPPREAFDDDPLEPEMAGYQPWTLQRGRSRVAMMLHLRRYESRSGLWTGWAMSYPNLIAVEYVGDRMLSLDFGTRQFVMQGVGLDQLVGPLQQGIVLALHEHSTAVWPQPAIGPIITSIRRVGMEEHRLHTDA